MTMIMMLIILKLVISSEVLAINDKPNHSHTKVYCKGVCQTAVVTVNCVRQYNKLVQRT